MLPGPPPLPDKSPKPRWPLFAALFLGLVAVALFQLPAVLLEPLNPESSPRGKAYPWITGAVVLAVLLVAAGVIWVVRLRRGFAVGLIVCLWILLLGGGLIAVRQSAMDRYANFDTAVLGNANSSTGHCEFLTEEGRFEVYLLNSGESTWHLGDPVPFGDDYSGGAGAPPSYRNSFTVEWDPKSISWGGGATAVFGPEDIDTDAESYDIKDAAVEVGANDRCGAYDYGNSYIRWADTTRVGLESQTVYIASSVCQQAIPVLKTQILASDPSDCDLERSLAEARLDLDPDYEVYR